LDTKIKSPDDDPDKRWITTWNDYLGDIKKGLMQQLLTGKIRVKV